jgi:DNA-3-methyladenine glycosylase I
MRCSWAVDGPPEYIAYHDDEWGRPTLSDAGLFERLTLESFQSGLSWITILRKRPAFRVAFEQFAVPAVASFGDGDRARLLADAGIVRNRAKIEAAIGNARAALAVIEEHGSLAALLWRFAPPVRRSPGSRADLVGASPESAALAAELKRRSFAPPRRCASHRHSVRHPFSCRLAAKARAVHPEWRRAKTGQKGQLP